MSKYSILPDVASHLRYQSEKYKFEVIGQPNPNLVMFREVKITQGEVELAYLSKMSLPHFHKDTDTVFYPLARCLSLHGKNNRDTATEAMENSVVDEVELAIVKPYEFLHAPKGDIHSFGPCGSGEVLALLLHSSSSRGRVGEYPDDTTFCTDLAVKFGNGLLPGIIGWFDDQSSDWKAVNIHAG